MVGGSPATSFRSRLRFVEANHRRREGRIRRRVSARRALRRHWRRKTTGARSERKETPADALAANALEVSLQRVRKEQLAATPDRRRRSRRRTDERRRENRTPDRPCREVR